MQSAIQQSSIFLIFTFLSHIVYAGPTKTDSGINITITPSEIVSIYDGDTFKINIVDWPAIVGEKIPIRIRGIDTPEIRGKCYEEKVLALQARNFMRHTLRNAKKISLKNISRGKYFRLVADVYVDGVAVSNLLINKQLAIPYSKVAKPQWCKKKPAV